MRDPTSKSPLHAQPHDYFGYAACRSCTLRPCTGLRYGGVYPGKCAFVHSREHTGGECVFTALSADEIRDLLSPLSLDDLDYLVQSVITDLSPAERLHYDHRHCIWRYAEHAARVEYLLRLWDDGVIVCLRIPHTYQADPRLRAWLHATGGGADYQLKRSVREDDEPAVTDVLVDELSRPRPSLSNPAWSHTDESRTKQSPTQAVIGDTLLLSADVTNIVEGATVTFEVLDTTECPARTIARLRGTVHSRSARAEWTVERSQKTAEPKYAFEAVYEDIRSSRCSIPVLPEQAIWFHIDLDNPLTDDDRMILRTTDGTEEHVVYMKDMVESREDFVLLQFPWLEDGKRYDLIYDMGAEGAPVYYERDADRKYLLDLDDENTTANDGG